MGKGIYIAGAEAHNGKSVIVLGIMEMLAGRREKIGFFRPVVQEEGKADGLTALIGNRYGLRFPATAMYGCGARTARELLLKDRDDELLKLILDKYKALEQECDFIVCVGSDYTSPAAALEFDVNARVANNLGCPVLPVVKGLGKEVGQIVGAARGLIESLEDRQCDILGLVVNRVDEQLVPAVRADLQQTLPQSIPAYVLPELPFLGKPTVGEIGSALDAERVSGPDEGLQREVACFKVAAMELPHYLEHIEEGSLVIVPGDRADIILGTLLADAAETYPRIAGIVLTGGFRPAPQVQRLLDGVRRSPVPILVVPGDTYATALDVSSVESALSIDNPRKIAAAIGLVEAGLNPEEFLDRLAMARPARVTPLMFEHELIRRARSRRQHIVLPEGDEERILRAAEILRMRDVADLTLLGPEEEIRRKAAQLGLALGPEVRIVDPLTSPRRQDYADTYFTLRKHKGISPQMAFDTMADVSYFGTMMVHLGEADGMVSGAVHTTQHTIRPALEFVKTRPGCAIVSSVFFMCLADRVLVFGDCAVNPDPTSEQLADIAISSAETAQAFGIEPLIALLSYSTGESGKGAEVDKVRAAARIAREQRPDLKIEGPIQYDAAVDEGVAKTKLPGSEVAGHATVFIFPDLNTGNNTYKAVQRAANAVAVGPVLQGLNKPVNDLSRGCTVPDIVNTVAITAIQAQGKEGAA